MGMTSRPTTWRFLEARPDYYGAARDELFNFEDDCLKAYMDEIHYIKLHPLRTVSVGSLCSEPRPQPHRDVREAGRNGDTSFLHVWLYSFVQR